VKPILDRVLVTPEEEKEQISEGGIILNDESKYSYVHPTRKGIVKEVGPGKRAKNGKLVEMTVKPGDYIHFAGQAGISLSGKEGKFTKNEDILITEDDIFFVKRGE